MMTHEMRTSAIAAPRTVPSLAAAAVDRFVQAAALADGVNVADLRPLDELAVQTRNSIYRIVIVAPSDGRILVQGGAFFPLPCQAHLCGGTLGGSLLKLNWIGCGFNLEILHEGRRIVTTRVRSIAIDRDGARAH
jgi:hypothetical protein